MWFRIPAKAETETGILHKIETRPGGGRNQNPKAKSFAITATSRVIFRSFAGKRNEINLRKGKRRMIIPGTKQRKRVLLHLLPVMIYSLLVTKAL